MLNSYTTCKLSALYHVPWCVESPHKYMQMYCSSFFELPFYKNHIFCPWQTCPFPLVLKVLLFLETCFEVCCITYSMVFLYRKVSASKIIFCDIYSIWKVQAFVVKIWCHLRHWKKPTMFVIVLNAFSFISWLVMFSSHVSVMSA